MDFIKRARKFDFIRISVVCPYCEEHLGDKLFLVGQHLGITCISCHSKFAVFRSIHDKKLYFDYPTTPEKESA